MIYANTTTREPTHFMAALGLIQEARETFNICSENWPYPTRYRFGFPEDRYYAEVWLDGMDWQNSYWLIETHKLGSPKCMPLIVFEDHKNSDLLNNYDFGNILKAAMQYRRDVLWLNQGENGYHNEEVWPYLKLVCPAVRMKKVSDMWRVIFEHASQESVTFYMNKNCIPSEYLCQSSS